MGSAHGKEGRRAFLLELCLHRALTGTRLRSRAWAAAGATVTAVGNVGPGAGAPGHPSDVTSLEQALRSS